MSKITSFAADIRPLFTDRDIQGMSKAFNLASYDDVKTHAPAIHPDSRVVVDPERIRENRVLANPVKTNKTLRPSLRKRRIVLGQYAREFLCNVRPVPIQAQFIATYLKCILLNHFQDRLVDCRKRTHHTEFP